MKKLSQDTLTKLAQQETVDRNLAFEFGFAQAAAELKLTKPQYDAFYKIACAKLAQAQPNKKSKKA